MLPEIELPKTGSARTQKPQTGALRARTELSLRG